MIDCFFPKLLFPSVSFTVLNTSKHVSCLALAISNPKRKLSQKFCSSCLPPPSSILATCSNGLTGATTHMSPRVWVGPSSSDWPFGCCLVSFQPGQFSDPTHYKYYFQHKESRGNACPRKYVGEVLLLTTCFKLTLLSSRIFSRFLLSEELQASWIFVYILCLHYLSTSILLFPIN